MTRSLWDDSPNLDRFEDELLLREPGITCRELARRLKESPWGKRFTGRRPPAQETDARPGPFKQAVLKDRWLKEKCGLWHERDPAQHNEDLGRIESLAAHAGNGLMDHEALGTQTLRLYQPDEAPAALLDAWDLVRLAYVQGRERAAQVETDMGGRREALGTVA